MPGLFVAMLSFPRTVLSLKQSTEPTQVHLDRLDLTLEQSYHKDDFEDLTMLDARNLIEALTASETPDKTNA